MKCPKCGKDNPIGSKFCNGCGEKLPEQNLEQIWKETQEETKEQAPITTEKSKFADVLDKRLITAIGIILALFVTGIIITVYVKSCVESQNSSVVAATEADTESTAAELLAESDLDRTASFYDIKFKVSTKWEHKNGYDENGDIYQINGKYYFVSAQRQEATTEVADAFIKLICDNDDNEYTSIMEDNINGVDGVTYSVVIDDKSYTRTTCFYRNGYIYSVALTALKEYKSVVDESFLLIRSSIKFAEIETEPETEKPTEPETDPPTPEPTEPPTEAPTSITDTLPLIFSSDEFDIYFVSAKPYKYDDTETLVKFLINNKYNTQMTFQADTIILDGISYSDVIMSDPVSANSLGYIEATIEDCTNSNPSAVGGDLRFFDTIGEGATRGDINIPSTNIK